MGQQLYMDSRVRGGLQKVEGMPRPLAPTRLAQAGRNPRSLLGDLGTSRQLSASSGGTTSVATCTLHQPYPRGARGAILPDREASSRSYQDGPKVAALLSSPYDQSDH